MCGMFWLVWLTGVAMSGNKMLAEKQDEMIERQDKMLQKQDQTTTVIKSGVDEMREFREETQQNFTNIDVKSKKTSS